MDESGAYWSFDPVSQTWVFTPIGCAEQIETLSQVINKYFTYVLEDEKTYPNPEELIEEVSTLLASDDQDRSDQFMAEFYQEVLFFRLGFVVEKYTTAAFKVWDEV